MGAKDTKMTLSLVLSGANDSKFIGNYSFLTTYPFSFTF